MMNCKVKHNNLQNLEENETGYRAENIDFVYRRKIQMSTFVYIDLL